MADEAEFDVTTEHPQYIEYLPIWQKCALALKGEEAIKSAGTSILPKTSGMIKNKVSGEAEYEAYKNRARFYDISAQARSALIGLMFEKPPEGNADVEFALSGEDDIDYSVTLAREVFAKGRYIAVTDAYSVAGDSNVKRVMVTSYCAESMINWKTDSSGNLILAVFQEEVDSGDEFSHDTDTQYRVWRYDATTKTLTINVYNEKSIPIQKEVAVPNRPNIGIIVFGSIDLKPNCDPIPILPIVNCAISAYKLSADYKHSLFMVAQPTPVLTGIKEKQWKEILKQGIGSSALWWLGDIGQAAFLEVSGNGIESLKEAILDELKHAESYAVKLTQADSGGVEAMGTVAMRSASQMATVHTVIRTIEEGINALHEILVSRNGSANYEEYQIHAEFSPVYATAQMLTAINNSVSQQNIPATVLFEALRKMKITEKTDEELLDELQSQPGFGLPPVPPEPKN